MNPCVPYLHFNLVAISVSPPSGLWILTAIFFLGSTIIQLALSMSFLLFYPIFLLSAERIPNYVTCYSVVGSRPSSAYPPWISWSFSKPCGVWVLTQTLHLDCPTESNLLSRTHWWNWQSSSSTASIAPHSLLSITSLSLRPNLHSGVPEK